MDNPMTMSLMLVKLTPPTSYILVGMSSGNPRSAAPNVDRFRYSRKRPIIRAVMTRYRRWAPRSLRGRYATRSIVTPTTAVRAIEPRIVTARMIHAGMPVPKPSRKAAMKNPT
jgi:hypothetical protein